MKRISISEVRATAAEIQNELTNMGFIVEVKPYFAYGAYSYYFNFIRPGTNGREFQNFRQKWTTLDTKRECIRRMWEAYRDIVCNENYYKFID